MNYTTKTRPKPDQCIQTGSFQPFRAVDKTVCELKCVPAKAESSKSNLIGWFVECTGMMPEKKINPSLN